MTTTEATTEPTTDVGAAIAAVEQLIGELHAKSATLTAAQITAIRRHATAIAQYAEEMREA